MIGLKENQPKLYKTAASVYLDTPPLSMATTEDNTHKRFVKRECRVFAVPERIQKIWSGLKTFVVVDRIGIRDEKPWSERQFYISSQVESAQQMLALTVGHWGIENRVHWVRDVTFKEDFPERIGGYAPVNWAILNNFLITIARLFNFRTIPQAQRVLSNQLEKIFNLLIKQPLEKNQS